jgi:hypothetical protein
MALLMLCLCAARVEVCAQTALDGAVVGRVVDATGAAVRGSAVLLLDGRTGQVRAGATDGRGEFAIAGVEAGEYTLTARSAGFAEWKSEIVVRLGAATEVEPRLRVAQVSAAVTVTAEPVVMRVETAELGGNVAAEEMQRLPAEARGWERMAAVAPGVVEAPNTEEDARGERDEQSVDVMGMRGMAGTMGRQLVDGLDDSQEFFAAGRGRWRAAYGFTREAIRELQVDEAGYALNAVTRGGGRVAHGSGFYVLRDSRLGAVNPFWTVTSFSAATDTASSQWVRPADTRQQFGGSVSGPAGRRTSEWMGAGGGEVFYFLAGEAQLRRFPAEATPRSDAFYALIANQTALLGNRGVTTAAMDAALGYLSGLGGEVGRRGDESVVFPKLEWLRGRGKLSVQYNRMRWDSPAGAQTQAVVARGRASLGNDFAKVDAGQAAWRMQATPRWLVDVRGQWSRDFEYESAQLPLTGEPATGPGGFAPQIGITPDGFTFGTPETVERAAYPDERRAEGVAAVVWERGRKAVRAGGEWSRVTERINSLPDAEGSYAYEPRLLLSNGLGQPNGLADWVTDYTFGAASYPSGGCPAVQGGTLHYFCFRDYAQGFGPSATEFNLRQWAGYVQGEWRAAHGLTVTASVRYELEQLPPAQQPNAAIDAAFASVGSTSAMPSDKNNVGPRVGVAWSVPRRRTTVKAGYGVFYGRVAGETVRTALSDTAVLGANGLPASAFHVRITPTTSVVCGAGATAPCNCPPGSGGFGYPCTFSTYPAGVVAVTNTASAVMFDHRFRLPMVQQGSLTVEQELRGRTLVSVSYAGALSRQLPNFVDANIAASTGMGVFQMQGGPFDGETFVVPVYTLTGANKGRVNSNYGPVTDILSNINGSYNAVTLTVRREMRHGWMAAAHWTWEKAMDDGQSSTSGVRENAQFDPFNVRYDKAVSDLDRPHRVVAEMVWEPQGVGAGWRRGATRGWQISGIFADVSGRGYSYGVRGGTWLNGGRLSVNGSGGATYLPTVGRNTLRLPDAETLDVRLARRWRLDAGRVKLSVAAEGFNVLNRVNYSSVNTTAYDVGTTTSGVTQLVFQSVAVNPVTPFGGYTGAATSLTHERQVQVSVRVEF